MYGKETVISIGGLFLKKTGTVVCILLILTNAIRSNHHIPHQGLYYTMAESTQGHEDFISETVV